jgi:hypothetical protein
VECYFFFADLVDSPLSVSLIGTATLDGFESVGRQRALLILDLHLILHPRSKHTHLFAFFVDFRSRRLVLTTSSDCARKNVQR